MNDKFTKRDILSALGLYAIIGGLIVSTILIGKALGVPEFLNWF